MAIHVLLLREPSEIPDKYESAFAAVPDAEYVAHSFPVLETAFAKVLDGIAPSEITWSAPFYVVGKATAAALRNSSGTAEQLAHFIMGNRSHSGHPTLLYLTGDKNRDTLPSILTPTFTLQPLKVYETTAAKDISERLRAIVPSLSTGRWWFVFFAPSSAQFTWPHLQPYYEPDDIGIAAIGPTTATFLQDDLGRRVAALVKAIMNVEDQRRRQRQ
ncbi:tetrapyrrole biosynthesis, uroporphyrinogen III synthase [Hymenopellis radicata]|nr:tetrapyrrole biosynthesis, uroporphyrinogen III synthase [Hymenopellis radicata]